jgi:hypothetical protein
LLFSAPPREVRVSANSPTNSAEDPEIMTRRAGLALIVADCFAPADAR